jgi:type IV pilus assembly protein PilE
MKTRKTAGFTLVELLLVVVIIGTLAAMAIPKFFPAATRSKQTEAKMMLKQIYTMQRSYFEEFGSYNANLALIGVQIMPQARYAYTVVVNGTAFVATANCPDPGVDDDPAPDTWTINEQGLLVATSNDVTAS